MIAFNEKGDFEKLTKYLLDIKGARKYERLKQYAEEGVKALSSATPVDTGKTASSWSYEIDMNADSGQVTISWNNSNINKGINIAALIQYGHGTGTGGWVAGVDYINPAIKPVMDKIIENLCREVAK